MHKNRLPTARFALIAALTALAGTISSLPVALAQTGAATPKVDPSQAATKAAKPKVDRNFPEILERVAFRAAKSGNHKAAAIFYRRVLEQEPHRRSAKLGLAKSLSRLGRQHDAIGIYRDALAADPGDMSVRSGLGAALLSIGQPRDALPHLKMALDTRKTVETLNQVGVASLLAGAPERAQQYFAQGLEIRPGHYALLNNNAIALYRSGQRTEAQAVLAKQVRDRNSPVELRKNFVLMETAIRTGASPSSGLSLLSARRAEPAFVVARIDPARGRQLVAGSAALPRRMAQVPPIVPVGTVGGRTNMAGTLPPGRISRHAASGVARRPAAIAPIPGGTGLGVTDNRHRRRLAAGIAANLGKTGTSGPPYSVASRALGAPGAASPVQSDAAIRVATAGPSGLATRASAPTPGFRVQLGAFRDAGNAEAAQRRLMRGMGSLFRDLGIGVERVDTANKGKMFKLRTETATDRASADALCARLRARSVGCFVAKHSPG